MGVDGDWTWVLRERCPDCGLDVQTLDRDGLGARARSVVVPGESCSVEVQR